MDRGEITRVWLPLLIGAIAVGGIYAVGPGPRDSLRYAGLGLTVFGLSGILLARYTLGKSFAIAPKAQALVTRGIYSRIRNPLYISSVIFISGIWLMMRKPAFGLLLLVVVPMQIMRARAEARVLEEKFGDSYRAYRAATWF
jgi:protein-S-isoprenylcysteine O-methyltransferase Ste14